MKKCKYCRVITCNKKATIWIDETFKLRNGEIQQKGYCTDHHKRLILNRI